VGAWSKLCRPIVRCQLRPTPLAWLRPIDSEHSAIWQCLVGEGSGTIAGLILTLAVAVDANVLIYERMRDELRAGRSIIAAMDAGFSRAMGTIMDANITHLLSAAIMFNLGSGPVKGFAWTLAIGVLTTVFSAVLVTQVLLAWWFRAARPKTLPIA